VMKSSLTRGRTRLFTSFGAITACSVLLWGCGGGGSSDQAIPLTVPKASCGSHHKPETGLQGQVPSALRAASFQGFNCNLQLIGQSKGDGANWQTDQFKDGAGRTCAYHGTSWNQTGRAHLGVPVIDISNRSNPTPTTYLTTPSLLDPWESLKVNERR